MLNTKSLYLLFSGSVITLTSGCIQKKDPVKPNVLFILADDLGYHDLSCTGSKYYETPNVDRISRE